MFIFNKGQVIAKWRAKEKLEMNLFIWTGFDQNYHPFFQNKTGELGYGMLSKIWACMIMIYICFNLVVGMFHEYIKFTICLD